jgi:hypothetical protein
MFLAVEAALHNINTKLKLVYCASLKSGAPKLFGVPPTTAMVRNVINQQSILLY